MGMLKLTEGFSQLGLINGQTAGRVWQGCPRGMVKLAQGYRQFAGSLPANPPQPPEPRMRASDFIVTVPPESSSSPSRPQPMAYVTPRNPTNCGFSRNDAVGRIGRLNDSRTAHGGREPRRAAFPGCRFWGLSSPQLVRRAGKPAEPAGRKACPTRAEVHGKPLVPFGPAYRP